MGCPVNVRSPNVPPGVCSIRMRAGQSRTRRMPRSGHLTSRSQPWGCWSPGHASTLPGAEGRSRLPWEMPGSEWGTWTEKAGAVKLWGPGQVRHLQGRVTGAELVLRWGECAQPLRTMGSKPQPRQTGFSRARDYNAHVMVFLPKARKGL